MKLTVHNLIPKIKSITYDFVLNIDFEPSNVLKIKDKEVIINDYNGLKVIVKKALKSGVDDSLFFSFLGSEHCTTAHREFFFKKIALDVFGIDSIPDTTLFRVDSNKGYEYWSAQVFHPDCTNFSHKSDLQDNASSNLLYKLCFLDVILGNGDRHCNNIITDKKGQLYLIDNSLTFDYAHFAYVYFPAYAKHIANTPVPFNVLSWLKSIDGVFLATEMINLGIPIQLVCSAGVRLHLAQSLANIILANKDHYCGDLNNFVEYMLTHQLTSDSVNSVLLDVRNDVLRRIRRGESSSVNQSSFDSKTVVSY
jgi:hypothetical protein